MTAPIWILALVATTAHFFIVRDIIEEVRGR
jgi:hypothetical protein